MSNIASINNTLIDTVSAFIEDAREWLPEYKGYSDSDRQELVDFVVSVFEGTLELIHPDICLDARKGKVYHPKSMKDPLTLKDIVDVNWAVTELWEFKCDRIISRKGHHRCWTYT